MKKKRRILYLTTELSPFNSESPLSELSHHLTRIYRSAGHDIRVVMPKYSFIRDRKYNLREVIRLREIPVPIAGRLTWVSVKSGFVPDTRVQVYFLEHGEYFAREGVISDPSTSEGYQDNDERFIVFCRAAVEMLKILSWQPQIVHCSDWNGALFPFYLRRMYANDNFYKPTKVILSLTDYDRTGSFPPSSVFKAGINPDEFHTGTDFELDGQFSFLKTGIVNSNKVIINGPASAAQFPPPFRKWFQNYIQDNPDNVVQIPFGLNYNIWNPDKDEKICANYSHRELTGKAENKMKLAAKYSLELEPDAPLVGCIWNGTDLSPLKEIVELIADYGGRLVIADKNSDQAAMEKFAQSSPGNIGAVKLLTGLTIKQLLAGSDMLILSPVKDKELLHLKAMKYGAVPIAPNISFFADDIVQSDEKANGFLFDNNDTASFKDTMEKALKLFENRKDWTTLTKSAMKLDTTWNKTARAVLDVYDAVG